MYKLKLMLIPTNGYRSTANNGCTGLGPYCMFGTVISQGTVVKGRSVNRNRFGYIVEVNRLQKSVTVGSLKKSYDFFIETVPFYSWYMF